MRTLHSLIVASLLVMLSSSCGTSLRARQEKAAATVGTAQAATATVGKKLPPLPDKLRKDVPHAEVKVGMDPVEIVIGERGSTNAANARANAVIKIYDRAQKNL